MFSPPRDSGRETKLDKNDGNWILRRPVWGRETLRGSRMLPPAYAADVIQSPSRLIAALAAAWRVHVRRLDGYRRIPLERYIEVIVRRSNVLRKIVRLADARGVAPKPVRLREPHDCPLAARAATVGLYLALVDAPFLMSLSNASLSCSAPPGGFELGSPGSERHGLGIGRGANKSGPGVPFTQS